MVRLSKIYTKTGDDGTTGLGDGKRVTKDSLRVEAYGTVDEANAAIGVAIAIAERNPRPTKATPLADTLRSLQHDLFDAGADLCTPIAPGEKRGVALRITPAQTVRLEKLIDRYNKPLPPLKSFVLPGGSELAAALHVARTAARRAERLVVALARDESAATSKEVVLYLNRLSDLLFVLARAANRLPGQPGDVLWVPGRNRPGAE
ncbi:MAG TPA: cob(I)yrinic acid a,c-diamide adenosyltransferase [Phycisphaerales bacterium]|nr:cob(I)yrinic acid a,c-diamide adenosyltransferase [Phycisphaerales bacterium]